jgi:putative sigma-54 modulation protein
VQIEITTRHGSLTPEQQKYLHDKAEKLIKYFNRLMAIQVNAEQLKYSWQVEIVVSAEHKHDFVATEVAATPEAAMDLCEHKIEQQLRRYKEKVQEHRDAVPSSGTSPTMPDLPEPPGPV